MKTPKPEVMFERLLAALKMEKSVLVPGKNPRMSRGLTLSVVKYIGISVLTHSGFGMDEGQILVSKNAEEFAGKVRAIEEAIQLQNKGVKK